ncbi:hypothetical protein H5410_062602 [Solanum commersonii]|uniref:Fatty acid desaturase domain-containing protein n=1 Tax=Solanum commersonii TaxID=4109 RepID=A0A9J5WC07_SOLCO|nr:hypothetical protein H5410_062602 [Solanum commersonii]
MGGGGNMSSMTTKNEQKKNPLERVPSSKPPFTLGDVKKAIPPHCFQRSLIRCVCTGIWVIDHECGHHGISDYQWVDDTVGLILHSTLLTPYFAWKHSHRRHHANIDSLENDEVYIPRLKSKLRWYYKYLNNPLGRIYISDAGVIAVTYLLYRVTLTQGLAWVLCIYGVPLLIVNGFIVLITLMHHTHSSLPHYDSSEWDYLRGALATVDRDYGVLNKVFHNVTDMHVLHHIFSYISHYHAMEATKAIKPLLGEYYKFDDTPILKAMWRDTKECIFVEKDKDKGVYWYKNKL